MSKELKFAIKLARDAGKILMDGLDKAVVKRYKIDRRDIVTSMDLKSEELIVSRIKKEYPNHKIYSEECGKIKASSDYVWIIDPLDGTKYYAAGVNFFDLSIALWKGNEPVLGVVYSPASDDLYWAEKGKGAFCNNRKIKVSKINKLDEAIVYLEIAASDKLKPDEYKLAMERFELIFKNIYRFRGFGLGARACCYIAQGGYDAYFDLTGKEEILDLAAGIIIAKEAGAKITGLDGKFQSQDTSHVVITNGKIHNDFLKLLNNQGYLSGF